MAFDIQPVGVGSDCDSKWSQNVEIEIGISLFYFLCILINFSGLKNSG